MVKDFFIQFMKRITEISSRLTSGEEEKVSFDWGARYAKGVFCGDKGGCRVFLNKNGKEVISEFTRWLHDNGLSSKEVVVAIKGDSTLIRYIPFPKMEKKGIKEAFEYEIGKYIPFNHQNVYFDVAVVDENYSPREFLVLLSVVKKDFLDSILKPFHEERVKVSGVTLNSVALINLLLERAPTAEERGNLAVVDIGYSSTLLNMFKGKVPCLSREIKISAKNFLDRLAEIRNVSVEEVEKLIMEGAGLEEGDSTLRDVAEEVFVDLCDEIKSSFDYFELNWATGIDALYLTGGVSFVKEVGEVIAKNLNTPVKIWDPFVGKEVSEEVSPYRHVLAVSLGAGL